MGDGGHREAQCCRREEEERVLPWHCSPNVCDTTASSGCRFSALTVPEDPPLKWPRNGNTQSTFQDPGAVGGTHALEP